MNKKKLVVLMMSIAMVAALAIGGTLAYFTDTHSMTNTFTSGQVGITLDEAVVKVQEETTETARKDDLVADGDNRTEIGQEYTLYPAQTVLKDPTITVDEGSLPSYLGAIITVTGDVHELMTKDGMGDYIDIHTLVSGGLVDETSTLVSNWEETGLDMYVAESSLVYQKADKANNTWTFYVFVKEIKEVGDEVVLFTTLSIPAEYDNDKMAKLNGMNINVQAFATQEAGFDDCYDAMISAFPTNFPFIAATEEAE